VIEMGRLGAHVSISGGVSLSIERALDLGLESFQIFTRNQRQWDPAPLSSEEILSFKESLSRSDLGPVLVHSSYLINIAAGNERVASRSLSALEDEIFRCRELGLERLVLHPGSHKGDGLGKGISRIAGKIKEAYGDRSSGKPTILLETTAGQGTGIGSRFEELREIMDQVDRDIRPGICLDTCHMHSAGYDITGEEAYASVMDELNETVGFENVLGIHLNDSQKELGSRVDRHANIGKGTIGTDTFSFILNDERFSDVPMVLETPGGKDAYKKDLDLLRKLLG
jgi:deoxyribonuclease-4